MSKHTIYIVEDHEGMRELLREFIDETPNMRTCGVAPTAEQAEKEIPTLAPNLLLIDISLPGMDGLELVGRVTALWPELPCLLMSGHRQTNYAQKALASGAKGYLIKGDPDELTRAIRRILSGDIYVSPALKGSV